MTVVRHRPIQESEVDRRSPRATILGAGLVVTRPAPDVMGGARAPMRRVGGFRASPGGISSVELTQAREGSPSTEACFRGALRVGARGLSKACPAAARRQTVASTSISGACGSSHSIGGSSDGVGGAEARPRTSTSTSPQACGGAVARAPEAPAVFRITGVGSGTPTTPDGVSLSRRMIAPTRRVTLGVGTNSPIRARDPTFAPATGSRAGPGIVSRSG